MSISLEKRAEKIGIILAKHDIVKVPPIRVGLALDTSGSTKNLYARGVIQETVDRLLAVSLKFDDNGELDMWSFNDDFTRLETAGPKDYGTYVLQHILNEGSVPKWGGTSYGGVLEDMVDFWFKPEAPVTKKSSGLFGLFGKKEAVVAPTVNALLALPAMGLLVTDGQSSNEDFAQHVLESSKEKNVYWQMVGVGAAHSFRFLQTMADNLPNVGYVNLESLEITDDELYGQLIGEEFINWVKKISK